MDAPGLGHIIKLSWYATHDDPPVYTHKVNSRLLHEVGFFDHALNGRFAEAAGVINIYHPSVTRENVIAWLKFRQWITGGFVGDDPRGLVSTCRVFDEFAE